MFWIFNNSENNLLTKFWVLSLFSQDSATASAVYRARAASTQSPPKSCKIWTVKALLSIEKHLIVILNFLHFIVLQQSGRVWGTLSMSWGLTWFSCTTVSKVLANSLWISHFMLTAPWSLSWLRLSLSAGPVSLVPQQRSTHVENDPQAMLMYLFYCLGPLLWGSTAPPVGKGEFSVVSFFPFIQWLIGRGCLVLWRAAQYRPLME